MPNIILSGCGGRLGSAVVRLAAASEDCAVVAGIDPSSAVNHTSFSFPVAATPDELDASCFASAVSNSGVVANNGIVSDNGITADNGIIANNGIVVNNRIIANNSVVVDCSHHTAALPLCAFATSHRLPLVIATTGHDVGELAVIRAASEVVPVFHSRNMSLGINLLMALVKKAAAALPGFDVEIVEYHHRNKLDAPSGTALMLADAAAETMRTHGDIEYVCDRSRKSEVRSHNEIGISSVRGGTVTGKHDVIFAGESEVITLSHEAESRDVFASGVLSAVRFIVGRMPGLYDMQSLVEASDIL